MKTVDLKVFENNNQIELPSGDIISEVELELVIKNTSNRRFFIEKLEELLDRELESDDRRFLLQEYDKIID